MRIDCQSHIFPRAYIDVLAQNPHPPQIELRSAVRDNPDRSEVRHCDEFVITYGDVQQFRLQEEMYLPERKLQDMDRAGIDMALISTNIPGPCMLAPDLAIKGSQAHKQSMMQLRK